MDIKVLELDGNDMMTIIELMSEMIADCKKKPKLLEMFPSDSTEIMVRVIDMVMIHKEEVAKAGKLAEKTLAKAAKP